MAPSYRVILATVDGWMDGAPRIVLSWLFKVRTHVLTTIVSDAIVWSRDLTHCTSPKSNEKGRGNAERSEVTSDPSALDK